MSVTAVELLSQPWNSLSLHALLIKQVRLSFPLVIKNISLFRFWDPFLRCVLGMISLQQQRIIWTPSGHPTVQLDFDTTWRQHRSPQVEDSAPQGCFLPTSDAVGKPRWFPKLQTSWP